jgi:hypothetical protein
MRNYCTSYNYHGSFVSDTIVTVTLAEEAAAADQVLGTVTVVVSAAAAATIYSQSVCQAAVLVSLTV